MTPFEQAVEAMGKLPQMNDHQAIAFYQAFAEDLEAALKSMDTYKLRAALAILVPEIVAKARDWSSDRLPDGTPYRYSTYPDAAAILNALESSP